MEQTNDQLKPIYKVTIGLCEELMNDESYYLPELCDKLIKLCMQLIIRHLNFIVDKVNEKKSIATARILYFLEDLYYF